MFHFMFLYCLHRYALLEVVLVTIQSHFVVLQISSTSGSIFYSMLNKQFLSEKAEEILIAKINMMNKNNPKENEN